MRIPKAIKTGRCPYLDYVLCSQCPDFNLCIIENDKRNKTP